MLSASVTPTGAESIQLGARKVNSKSIDIISKRENVNNTFAIFNIFSKFDFNDKLESFELLSKYILSRKKRKIKRKSAKKHLSKAKNRWLKKKTSVREE